MEGKGVLLMSERDEDQLIDLPPGFRFHPTDEEIINHYLTPKVMNNGRFVSCAIGEVDLNRCEPWDLPNKAKMGEKEWYFFCQRDRKYPTGMRTNRATDSGYWKATGKDKEIFKQGKSGSLVGMKKTLVFYKGRAPKGEKTNWVMHEYRLEGKFSYYNFPNLGKDEWVVSRIFHKNTGIKISPTAEHGMGMNSFVDDMLDSSAAWLPPLTDPPPSVNDEVSDYPSFSKFKETFGDDTVNGKGSRNYLSDFQGSQRHLRSDQEYEDTFIFPYTYNFTNNTFQALSEPNSSLFFPQIPPSYLPSTSHEHQPSTKLEQYSRASISQDTGISTDVTNEISSSMVPNQDRQYEADDPFVSPPGISDLDSLLDY